MTIYCDRLRPRIALSLAAERLRGRLPPATAIGILDGPVSGAGERLAEMLVRVLRCRPIEVHFFAGHLRTPSGESVAAAARKSAFRLADEGAGILVARSPVLRRLNADWQRETVRLHVAKQLWLHAERVLLRALTVDSLSTGTGLRARLYVRWPAALPLDLREHVPANLEVRPAGRERPGWKWGRFSAVLWAARQWMRRARARREDPAATDGMPALLVPQEDDLSTDRSFRSQPHWLGGASPPFRTIVLRVGRLFDDHMPAEARARARLEVVSLQDLTAASADAPVVRQLGRDFRRSSLRGLLAARTADSIAANAVARLLTTAQELASFCLQRGVTAFLTSENYLLHADAMQVIASPLGIRTVSYQYANMPNASLPMIATSDQMVTFSPVFHTRFTWPGYPAPGFVDGGYVYDSSFELVAARARERRDRLERAGVRFVIGFFDESVQRDKYGWLNADEYGSEILTLLGLVDREPTIGLIFKTQFHQNLGAVDPALSEALRRGIESGRVEVPGHGRHRNVVLPAEVAKSSDITIGHVFGGTASLEAALAGCRSVMINSCGLRTETDGVYGRADIIRTSLTAVLSAIQDFRRGEPALQGLGDWSQILAEFDPYRDGRSAVRLHALLEDAVLRSHSRSSASAPCVVRENPSA